MAETNAVNLRAASVRMQRGAAPDGVVPLAELLGSCCRDDCGAARLALPERELACVVGLRRVLRRGHGRVRAGERAGPGLAALHERADRDERERHGDSDADRGDDGDQCVVQSWHVDGHGTVLSRRCVYAVYENHYATLL